MNKQEKMFAALLGLTLIAWMGWNYKTSMERAKTQAAAAAAEQEAAIAAGAISDPNTELTATPDKTPTPTTPQLPFSEPLPTPTEPEITLQLESSDLALTLSSHGGVIQRATLKQFNSRPGTASSENPPVTMEFTDSPALALSGLPTLPPNASYQVDNNPEQQSVTFTTTTRDGLRVTRLIQLTENYQITISDTLHNTTPSPLALDTTGVSMGVMQRGTSKNDSLSLDALPALPKAKVTHWSKQKSTKALVSAAGGGCSSSASAMGRPESVDIPVTEPQTWLAIKSRFFATGLFGSELTAGFNATLSRDLERPNYQLDRLAATALFKGVTLAPDQELTRNYTLYIGPKKLSILQSFNNGMEGIMEFGFFAWFCKLMVPTLNFFYQLIPSYGIAIILLTFLIRIIFWPLTHHSTQSMKRMQEVQPKLKEIQAQFKDNPQKMQQETWAIYREHKVNPMSSCLPMFIQIPVFIALFTVLRSAVELRYAPFLWIIDLSEPENLFAGAIPLIGSLNILPILMAGTMALQSYLTPTAGDPQQQRMMMIMMPAMMLFMFYSFPAALSLYWTVSQILSIIQMALMRRRSATKPDGTTPPQSRQQRRAAART